MRAAVARRRIASMPWSPPPNFLLLAPEEVHAWRARLELAAPLVERLRRTLSVEERERAARFRLPEAEARFTAARGMLRDILARYLDRDPSALRFGYGPHGKPFLVSPVGCSGLEFNLSHSHGMALCGVTQGRQIGVDVEKIRSNADWERIAARFFSARESAMLLSLPSERRTEAFFRCWCLKEAYLKALGEGLSTPLASFDVSVSPGELGRWALTALDIEPGHAAAVAVEGQGLRLRLWDWSPNS
jgi:4'-phosphopantetheinyl transferase